MTSRVSAAWEILLALADGHVEQDRPVPRGEELEERLPLVQQRRHPGLRGHRRDLDAVDRELLLQLAQDRHLLADQPPRVHRDEGQEAGAVFGTEVEDVGEQEAVLALVGRPRDGAGCGLFAACLDEELQVEEQIRPGGEDDRRVHAVRFLAIGQILNAGAVGEADLGGLPDLDAGVRVDVDGLADQVCAMDVLFDHHSFSAHRHLATWSKIVRTFSQGASP